MNGLLLLLYFEDVNVVNHLLSKNSIGVMGYKLNPTVNRCT